MTVKGLTECLKGLPPEAELALEEGSTKGRYNLVFVKPLSEIAFGIPDINTARIQTELPLQGAKLAEEPGKPEDTKAKGKRPRTCKKS